MFHSLRKGGDAMSSKVACEGEQRQRRELAKDAITEKNPQKPRKHETRSKKTRKD